LRASELPRRLLRQVTRLDILLLVQLKRFLKSAAGFQHPPTHPGSRPNAQTAQTTQQQASRPNGNGNGNNTATAAAQPLPTQAQTQLRTQTQTQADDEEEDEYDDGGVLEMSEDEEDDDDDDDAETIEGAHICSLI
jgi:hypothetical protein